MEENKCKTKVQKPCGPTKEKKNVVDLMKMVKKVWVHIEAKKKKKGNELLHYTIFVRLVNKSSGSTKGQKKER
jgi:hypothetical protein